MIRGVAKSFLVGWGMNLFGEQLGAGCSPRAIAVGLRELLGDECSPRAITVGLRELLGDECSPRAITVGLRELLGDECSPKDPIILSGNWTMRGFSTVPLLSSHFLGRQRQFQTVAVALVPFFGTTTTLSADFRCPRPIFWDDDDTCEPQNPTSDSPVIAAGWGMPRRVSIVGAMSQRRPSRTVRTSSSTTMNCTLFSEWAVLGVPSSLTA